MESNLVGLGIAIYIVGTLGAALGANLQRLSVTKNEKLPEDQRRKNTKRKLWWTGLLTFIGSTILMSVSLFFANTTIISPMQLFLLVFNAVFAYFINKERFERRDFLALFAVLVGVGLCVAGAPTTNRDYDQDEMIDLMKQPTFITFMCVTVALTALIWIWQWVTLRAEMELSKFRSSCLNISYGFLAGIVGGINITTSKSTFSLLTGEWGDCGIVCVLKSPVFWCFAILLIIGSILQFYFIAKGLNATSAVIVVSTQAVVQQVTASLGGILCFESYKDFETWMWPLYIIGDIIAVIAVIFLAHFRVQQELAEIRKAQLREVPKLHTVAQVQRVSIESVALDAVSESTEPSSFVEF